MTTFFMFGRYASDAVQGINAERTEKAEAQIVGFGGKMRSVYALLGDYDIVIIADLPGIPEAVQASVAIMRETGISFNTSPAIPVVDFDQLMTEE